MTEDEVKRRAYFALKCLYEGTLNNNHIEALQNYIDMLEYKDHVAQRTVKKLHEQYAHEGGKPQIMTIDILKKWFASIDVPRITDVFQTATPNVFYVSFNDVIYPEHHTQIGFLGFDIIEARGSLHNRYMVKWRTPPNDEY